MLIYGQPFSKVGAHPDDPASELMLSTAITPVEKRDDIKAHMHQLGPGFSAYWIRGSGTDAGVHVRLQGARRVAKGKAAKAAKKTSLPGWEGLRTSLPVHCARLKLRTRLTSTRVRSGARRPVDPVALAARPPQDRRRHGRRW